MRIISETEFRKTFCFNLRSSKGHYDYVVGPGRSGAIASVYASHYLGIPFLPYKQTIPDKKPLVVDTAIMSGKTLRKASRLYGNADTRFGFFEPPRVKFWYEELSIVRGIGKEFI